MRDIADAAGILSGSLYHHFDSKESMVDEILSTFQEELFGQYDEILASGDDARTKLERAVLVSFDAIDRHHDEVAIYQNDAAYLLTYKRFAYLGTRNQQSREVWLTLLRDGVDAGRKGVIVNNASVIGWRAQEGQAHYAAAKAGVMALTRCAALDVAPHGIRVNAVSPSLAMHPFLAKVTSDDLLAELKQREAFGRAAEPWEVANVMVFLASDYASYMTGEVVAVSSQQA